MTCTAYHHLPTWFKVKWDRQFHLKCLLWWLSAFLASELFLTPRKLAQHHRYNPPASGNQCLCLQVSTKGSWESVENVLENVTGQFWDAFYMVVERAPTGTEPQLPIIANQLKHISALVFLPSSFIFTFPFFCSLKTASKITSAHPNPCWRLSFLGNPNYENQFGRNKAISRERERNVEW